MFLLWPTHCISSLFLLSSFLRYLSFFVSSFHTFFFLSLLLHIFLLFPHLSHSLFPLHLPFSLFFISLLYLTSLHRCLSSFYMFLIFLPPSPSINLSLLLPVNSLFPIFLCFPPLRHSVSPFPLWSQKSKMALKWESNEVFCCEHGRFVMVILQIISSPLHLSLMASVEPFNRYSERK